MLPKPFIISDHAEEISKRIMEEMDRGVTMLDGRGLTPEMKRM